MAVHLSDNSEFKWQQDNHVYCCGYAFDDSGLLNASQLAKKFSKLDKADDWISHLDQLSGVFAIISETGGSIKAAVDSVRSIPLFFTRQKGEWHISNSAITLQEKFSFADINYHSAAEYLLTGYVTGPNTLFPDIKQVQAGEFIELSDDSFRHRYFEFVQKKDFECSYDDLIDKLHETHLRIFRQLIKSLDGRTAVIPISGGFDSRLIAYMLETLEYEPIQYFTYGDPGNWESKIAEEVTDLFDRELIYIPYSDKSEYESFKSDERKEYSITGGNLSSHSIIQDFHATGKLRKNDLIPQNSILIPGHSGGLLAGMHTPRQFIAQSSVSRNELVSHIFNVNFTRFKWQSTDLHHYFTDKIVNLLNLPEKLTSKEAISNYEKWIWQERQGKYIVNSLRTYDYWGYEWRIPLLDKQLMEFWLKVPVEPRAKRDLYIDYINKYFNYNVTPANSKKINKFLDKYNPFTNSRYGRFIGEFGLLNLISKRVKDIIELDRLNFPFIKSDNRILLEKPPALTSLYFINEILETTNAEFVSDNLTKK